MARKRQPGTEQQPQARKRTPTFLLELPLRVTSSQAKRLRAHLEAARQFYNAVLSEGHQRLRRMRADPAWQAARAIPRAQKLERQRAFQALRAQHGFVEYALRRRGEDVELHLDRQSRGCGAGTDADNSRLSQRISRVALGSALRASVMVG